MIPTNGNHNETLAELKSRIAHAHGRMADRLEVLQAQTSVQATRDARQPSEEQRQLEHALGALQKAMRDGWEKLDPSAADQVRVWLARYETGAPLA